MLEVEFLCRSDGVADQLPAQLPTLWQATKPKALFVTHSLSEALSLADRVLFLSSGPARVVLDVPIAVQGPHGLVAPEVQRLNQHLLADYSDLLKGRLACPA
ncbi:MAG: hypothetical protein HXX19_12925 [Rhodoferax sp.]|nr:hypothetical protein [Rhodoferax sp.]